MKLSKLDLGGVIAVAHTEGHLQLLVNRGDELELLEIPAPVQAFEGLQMLNQVVADAKILPSAPEPIAMLPVSSSMANAVGYDPNEQILQVEFHNGAVYQYSGVEFETWEELQDTDSIGRYFNHEIRGNYQCDRVEDEDYYC
jgi:KTSC domain